jgi:hypothetical protein
VANFVRIDSDGFVVDAIVIGNEHAPDPAPTISEPAGRAFIAGLARVDPRLSGTWVQTSFSGSFRRHYAAGKGYRYDEVADVFVAPAPFPSWVLDENHDWQPPVPAPEAPGAWQWDEGSLSWIDGTANGGTERVE